MMMTWPGHMVTRDQWARDQLVIVTPLAGWCIDYWLIKLWYEIWRYGLWRGNPGCCHTGTLTPGHQCSLRGAVCVASCPAGAFHWPQLGPGTLRGTWSLATDDSGYDCLMCVWHDPGWREHDVWRHHCQLSSDSLQIWANNNGPPAASHLQCQSVILEFHKSRIRLKCDLLPLAELCGGRGELRALYQL